MYKPAYLREVKLEKPHVIQIEVKQGDGFRKQVAKENINHAYVKEYLQNISHTGELVNTKVDLLKTHIVEENRLRQLFLT